MRTSHGASHTVATVCVLAEMLPLMIFVLASFTHSNLALVCHRAVMIYRSIGIIAVIRRFRRYRDLSHRYTRHVPQIFSRVVFQMFWLFSLLLASCQNHVKSESRHCCLSCRNRRRVLKSAKATERSKIDNMVALRPARGRRKVGEQQGSRHCGAAVKHIQWHHYPY